MITETAMIFDIQRFCLHDGPGIRTTVFFKGCPLRCGWCQNPESLRREPELAFLKSRCSGCGDCVGACPEGAITMNGAIRIEHNACKACGKCAEFCTPGALRIVGRKWSAGELAEEVFRDKDYFSESGGGVTLSGGEPLTQAVFVSKFCERMKHEGIDVLVETCGKFRWDSVVSLFPLVDMVYYDLKIMHPERHKLYTGVNNCTILDNFTRLTEMGRSVQARMPVIPGVNDDVENITATARFLRERGHSTVHCLPFHSMGTSKLEAIDSPCEGMYLESADETVMNRVKRIFQEERIDARIYSL